MVIYTETLCIIRANVSKKWDLSKTNSIPNIQSDAKWPP